MSAHGESTFSRMVRWAGPESPVFGIRRWKWVRLAVFLSKDAVLVALSYWVAFGLRFDDFAVVQYRETFLMTLPIVLMGSIVAFVAGGMYRQVWRYANVHSAILIFKCVLIAVVISVSANFIFLRELMPPRSITIIFALLLSAMIAVARFSWKAWAASSLKINGKSRERCLIYGAGAAGDLLARHIAANPNFPYLPIGYLDDDMNKRGRMIHGLRILGGRDDLGRLCLTQDVKTIIFAMHSPPGKIIRDLVARCREVGANPLIMPDMLTSLDLEIFQPRALDIKDLLRRSPKSIDRERVQRLFTNRVVLITGAGGSIGSEICRQVLQCKPRILVLLDSSEYNLYAVEQELRDLKVPGVTICSVLGSVICARTVERVFRTYQPAFVLHAAAYKHVPIIEANPLVGVVNNILGTRTVAEAAVRHRAERFLLVSTDKAVRSTNVMGSTKRCCELLIQALQALNPGGTRFCAVRFGNVLGSSGSVVPRFIEQIQSGGPVTVTHPDVTRYFMLISEAVGLVLQSITMSAGGEIFILDMGEPVRIVDMARDLILLAGKVPGQDVEIVFTGLRPGEKLYEELIIEDAERHQLHEDVYIAIPNVRDPRQLLAAIDEILQLAVDDDVAGCLRTLGVISEGVSQVHANDLRNDRGAALH